MLICPNGGQESPETFRFCPACAAPHDQPARAAREERKVVTVIFAALVGFTSRSEQLDPEDVGAVLAPYYATTRSWATSTSLVLSPTSFYPPSASVRGSTG